MIDFIQNLVIKTHIIIQLGAHCLMLSNIVLLEVINSNKTNIVDPKSMQRRLHKDSDAHMFHKLFQPYIGGNACFSFILFFIQSIQLHPLLGEFFFLLNYTAKHQVGPHTIS